MVMHQIHREENAKNLERTIEAFEPCSERGNESRGHELLDAGIIYPISDSQWVSLV